MKKLILILGISTSSIVCAASPIKNDVKTSTEIIKIQNQINLEQNSIKKIRFNGFIAYDTNCCGTCYQYGTYTEQDLGNGINYWEFESASQATSSTVITPPCTGAGSYLG
ncbi:hypothetical protein [Chryseobacterium paridis]|uniref:Uncharacterized protein n=1 Tax=Chryseobacterium paridis TaxID=2800328 RepID=A0ABS1FX30_9FLAO|nr:hypothetical protein [Chryseobacterium paridis]MBK1896969.1 hypothetical protein [Chryseobacterium paridis]